jgi:hypothetical protein
MGNESVVGTPVEDEMNVSIVNLADRPDIEFLQDCFSTF